MDDPKIPHMSKLFSNALPTKAPGDQYRFHPALNTLLSTVVPQKEKERRNKEKQKVFKKRMEDAANSRKGGAAAQKETVEVEAGEGSSSYDPVLFLLTPNQMIENEYPIPTYFPLSVEGFMKGSPEDVEKGNEVFLPWTGVGQEAEQVEKKELPTGWRETERATEGPKDGRYPVLAVDCEMVSGSPRRSSRTLIDGVHIVHDDSRRRTDESHSD
jgi:RNA exonuclease 1